MKITLFINVGILFINRIGLFKSFTDQTRLDIFYWSWNRLNDMSVSWAKLCNSASQKLTIFDVLMINTNFARSTPRAVALFAFIYRFIYIAFCCFTSCSSIRFTILWCEINRISKFKLLWLTIWNNNEFFIFICPKWLPLHLVRSFI